MTHKAPDPATRPQMGALTGIRGLAAWFVVFYHIRLSLTSILPAPVIAFLAKGYLAVDLFFILSGFVMWYTYADRLRQDGKVAAGQFLWRRMARIWPLHLLVLAGFAALFGLFYVTGRDTAGYPLAELPLHILLAQNWGLTRELSWNHPAWSISTELGAYLMFPLFVWAARWEAMRTALLLGLAAVLLGGLAAIFALGDGHDLGHDIPRLGLWRCLSEFTLGNLLCIVWQRWRTIRHTGVIALLVSLLGAAVGIGLGLEETVWLPFAFAAGLLALACGDNGVTRALGRGPLLYLGEISYSTYLVHFFLFILYKLAFVDASLQIGWTGLALFSLLLLAVSAALYHGWEKPAQRWLNRRAPALRRAEPAPSP